MKGSTIRWKKSSGRQFQLKRLVQRREPKLSCSLARTGTCEIIVSGGGIWGTEIKTKVKGKEKLQRKIAERRMVPSLDQREKKAGRGYKRQEGRVGRGGKMGVKNGDLNGRRNLQKGDVMLR